MSFDYEQLALDALEMLQEDGYLVRITRKGQQGSGYDVEPNPAADVDQSVYGIDVEEKQFSPDQTTFIGANRLVYVSASGLVFEPLPMDKIELRDGAHNIKECRPIAPGGTTVMYRIEVHT